MAVFDRYRDRLPVRRTIEPHQEAQIGALYENAQWVDTNRTAIDVDWHGARIRIAANPDLMHYRAVQAAGLTIAEPQITALKAELCAKVDEDAEAERLRHLTPGVGMVMTYQEKFAQAVAVEQMGETAANAMTEQERLLNFPILAASVGIEAPTLWQCATLVRERYTLFAALASGIERARLAGKAAIRSADTVESVRASYETIAWPTP